MKNTLLASFLILAVTYGLAQSPGGVSSGLQLWLKADEGTSSTTHGAYINNWADQSASGNDAHQLVSGSQPQYYANQFNGHPALHFSGGQFLDINLDALNNQDFTVFAVVKRESDDDEQYVLGIQETDDDDGFSFGFLSSEELMHSQYGYEAILDIPEYAGAAELPSIIFTEFGSTSGKKVYYVYDGESDNKKSTNKTHFELTGDGNIGRGNSNNSFTGLIAEIILFDRVLTTQEKKHVQTYLNIKYALAIPVSQHLYFSNNSYPNDLFGIGLSSEEGIDQAASKSANPGDILYLSSTADPDDSSFLIAGHNDEDILFDQHYGSNCAIDQILGRTWNLTRTGDLGTVSLRFDLTGISGFSPSQLVLLMDLNGNGFDDDSGISGTYNAPYFEVSNLDIPANTRVTLATGYFTVYAVQSGNTSEDIWSTSPTGDPEALFIFCDKANLIVPSGISVTNTWANLSCNDLRIEAGGIFNAGSGAINISGDVTVNGTLNAQTSTITMKGSGPQTIGGAALFNVYNLICDNLSGVTLDSNIAGAKVRNYVFVNKGTLYTNDKLILVSNATTTGMIAPLTSGTINGNVTVERYSNRSVAGWYMLSSPIQNVTVQDWNDDLVTTGFPGSDFPPPGYNFNNVRWYDEAVEGSKDDGYVGVTHINDTLKPRMGYFVYMNPGVMNLDVTGKIYSGNQQMPVKYTDTGNPGADGWNMLGNPYPCAVDWASPNWIKTNMDNAIYVWNPATKQYSSYVNGVGVNGGTRYIPSSQAFFVMANAASPVLTLRENCKSLAQGSYKFEEIDEEPSKTLSFSLTRNDLFDEIAFVLNDASSLNFDTQYDAYKLASSIPEAPYFASVSMDSHDLSINSFASLTEDITIQLRVKIGVNGTYKFAHQGLENFSDGACIVLEDLKTGRKYPLNEFSEVDLLLNTSDDEFRFLLHIGGTKLFRVEPSDCPGLDNGQAIVSVGQNSQCDLIWTNDSGEIINSVHNVSDTYELNGLTSGNYTLEIRGNGSCGTTETSFFIDNETEISADVTTNPTSCPESEDGEIIVHLEGGSGLYNLTWSNGDSGSSLHNLSTGDYSAIVTDQNGCKESISTTLSSLTNLSSSFETAYEVYELKNSSVSVDFINTSVNASAYTWDFGDATIANHDENPTHLFNQLGIFKVKLIAYNGDCESFYSKTIRITRAAKKVPGIQSEIIGTLTDDGVQLMFFFDQPRKVQVTAYNVLGQQIVQPFVNTYERETIHFSKRRYASNALIEVLDTNTGERAVLRLGQ